MSILASRERVGLLDARLELTRHLAQDELAELAGVSLPVVTVPQGRLELDELLTRHKAFGATLLDGLVMSSLRIGEQTGIQLLGPGDVLVPRNELFPAWLSDVQSRSTAPTRLGLFGDDLLAAAYRWPRIVQALYASIGEQLQRLTAQLVICQLPRVDDRVLAMLWLLSESWGHVTPSGVRLPLALTHETLGSLVGAARPTVTLALRKLTEQGAIVHQDSSWLLLEAPPVATDSRPRILVPEVAGDGSGLWTQAVSEAQDPSAAYAELRETVHRLREQHQTNRQLAKEQLRRARSARVRMAVVRQRIQEDALRRQRPPSA